MASQAIIELVKKSADIPDLLSSLRKHKGIYPQIYTD